LARYYAKREKKKKHCMFSTSPEAALLSSLYAKRFSVSNDSTFPK